MKITYTALCIASLFVAAGPALVQPAHAATITFQFSGSVTQVPLDEVFGDIASGDTFQGTLTFDSTAIDQVPADPTIGSYTSSSPFGLNVSVGAHDFEASGFLNIGILNSFVDQYTVLASSEAGDLTMDLFLLDNTGSALSNDQLPLGSPPLGSFAVRDFHLDGLFEGGEIQLDGEIGVPSTQAVPEPSPMILLTMISFVIFALAYRRLLLQSNSAKTHIGLLSPIVRSRV